MALDEITFTDRCMDIVKGAIQQLELAYQEYTTHRLKQVEKRPAPDLSIINPQTGERLTVKRKKDGPRKSGDALNRGP